MGIKEWIIPQDKVFFNLLEEQAELVLSAAKIFQKTVNDYKDVEQNMLEIKTLEHSGDDIVHKVFRRLHSTFITPIDHEDLSKLCASYDDVVDLINSVAGKMYLFNLKDSDAVIKNFADIIVRQIKETNHALTQIRKMNQKEIEKTFERVHMLENMADDLYNDAIANLFKEEDFIKILKMKDIYELLESITDKCEDVCLVLQDIVIKNA